MRSKLLLSLFFILLTPAALATRVALVIGIADYVHEPVLKNPVRDARLMRDVLTKDLKFDVVREVENPDRSTLAKAIAQFSDQAQGADAAIIYYSGHGMQSGQRRNYLIPRDIQVESDADLKANAILADDLIDALAGARIKLIILDACRNTPNGKKGGAKGLARMNSEGDGLLIAYATEDGKTAEDGAGTNSPYALALADSLRQTSKPILAQFDAVARSVRRDYPGQSPQRYGNLETDVYLMPQAFVPPVATPQIIASVAPSTIVPAVITHPLANPINDNPETSLWKAVEQGASADDYQVYLKQYPKGKYTALAKSRLQRIKDAEAQQVAVAEQSMWTAAESAQTVEGYAAYMNSYPNGRYATLAQTRSNKLKMDALAKEEVRVWKVAEHGTRADLRTYLERYPNGLYVTHAHQRDEELQRTPPKRPSLPFVLDDAIWKTIEKADSYINQPSVRFVKIHSTYMKQTVFTSAKLKTLPRPAPEMDSIDIEISPINDRCYRNERLEQNPAIKWTTTIYFCDDIPFANISSTRGSSDAIIPIKNLVISGSLYPPRVGAEQRIEYEEEYPKDHKFDSKTTSNCKLTERIDAGTIYSKLTGFAWAMTCHSTTQFPSNDDSAVKPYISDYQDFFIEDIGLRASIIGVFNSVEHRYVVPTVGTQLIAVETESLQWTHSFSSYDITIGEGDHP